MMKEKPFIVALQESFVAIVPYLVLASLALLLLQLFSFFEIRIPGLSFSRLQQTVLVINHFLSFVVLISIAYHFALRYHTNRFVAIQLSLAGYVTLLALNTPETRKYLLPSGGVSFLNVTLPIIATLLQLHLSRFFNLKLGHFDATIYIYRIFRYFYTFVVAYLLLLGIYTLLFGFGEWILPYLQTPLRHLSNELLLGIRTLLSQLFWFAGIHGPHMVNAFFDTRFLSQDIFPNLSYQEFYHLFGLQGGSGMGMALLLALLINYRDSYGIRLARISLPFVFFNINGILIYGLPVVFNRYFLIPFVGLPLLNLLIAYGVLSWHPVMFTTEEFTWTTPVFFYGYSITGKHLFLPFLQGGLLLLSTLIYLPFVRRYAAVKSRSTLFKELEKRLDIEMHLRAGEGVRALRKQYDLYHEHFRLRQIIRRLDNDLLKLYYQPKIDLKTGKPHSFEALLRLKSGREIQPPRFLSEIENAGFAPVIDLWVCRQVHEHLQQWKSEKFFPSISINLHPDTLHDLSIVKRIVTLLAGHSVEFEIIERSFVKSDKIRKSLQLFRQHGFGIAIDDFGVGYSSFELLTSCDIDTIKLDQHLVRQIVDPKGFSICRHIFALCRDLEIDCVAEGVETSRQIEALRRMDARIVQGYYFFPALPFESLRSDISESETKA